MLPSGKYASVPTFLCVAGINFEMCLYLTHRIKFKMNILQILVFIATFMEMGFVQIICCY